MGLLDKFFGGDDDSEARINSLIGANHKLTEMLSGFLTSHQHTLNRVVEQYNRLNEDVENIKKFLQEKDKK